MLVCLDTNIVIWGILEQSHSSQQEMIGRAKLFIENLTKSKARMMLPSPVVTELLLNVPIARSVPDYRNYHEALYCGIV